MNKDQTIYTIQYQCVAQWAREEPMPKVQQPIVVALVGGVSGGAVRCTEDVLASTSGEKILYNSEVQSISG